MLEEDRNRHDYSYDPKTDSHGFQEPCSLLEIRRIIGCILIAAGFIGAYWTFRIVYLAFSSPDTLPLYRDIAAEAVTIIKSQENLEIMIPSKFLAGLSTFLFLIISSTISCALIAQGVNVMNYDTQGLVRKINSLKFNLDRNFTAIKEILRRK
jgi:hypothetical protein